MDKANTDNLFGPLQIDFTDLESVEFNLIDFAHYASMHEDPGTKAFGRALKVLVPSWINFLKHEIDRDDDGGPGNAVIGLTKTFAMLAALTTVPATSNLSKISPLTEGIVAVFTRDIDLLAGYIKEREKNAEKHASS